MALPQKKRFSFFGSPPMSPVLSPTKNSTTLLSSYFSQEKHDDKLPSTDDVRKAKDNLERLVVAVEAYRDLVNKLGKASKTLSKALRDYGNSKGMENVYIMCFQTTSQFYDNHSEIQSKLNKALQKDFDLVQKYWDKYSKKVTKEEKTHNEYVGGLDKQIKKMSKDYEKKTKKDSKVSTESHSQYMASITAVGSDISRAQKEYLEKVVKREKRTHSIMSQTVCKLAEGHFAYFNESLKKCGPTITKMKEWAPFAGEDMPPPQDLDIFLEDQTSQSQLSQSDINSVTTSASERKSASIASISEKQLAAMNLETKLSFNEDTENTIPAKYMQVPEPKFPVITSPETTKPTYPHSLVLDEINNIKNDENTTSSSPTSSVSSTSIVQPAPGFPVIPALPTRPLDTKSIDLISRFSIGIHDDDSLFLRDEKVVEVHHPEILMESKVEKTVSKPNLSDQEEKEIKEEEEENITNNVNEEEEKGDKKDIKVQNESQPEKKDIKLMTVSPLENIIHNRDNVSDSSNTTLNDDKKNNETSNTIETKREEPPSEKPDKNNNETINIINKPIIPVIKDEEKEITKNEKKSSIDKNFKPNLNDDSLNNKQSSPQIPSKNPEFIPGEFPPKNKEISSNNLSPRPPVQAPRQVEYFRNDDDYRKEYSREDTELYDNEIRVNEMNRYTNGDMIRRDEGLLYDPPVRGERMRFNDNYRRTQQYDDNYESYDYIPSHGSYVTRDRSPPRTGLPYSQRPYGNNVPISSSSSVREITNRLNRSMNEDRRPISSSTRNTPIPTSGRVTEMTSRFGERRNKRDEVNPPRINNPHGEGDYGYENVDDRYNEPTEYRGDRYVQYNDLHDRHCNCHSCRAAVENSIHNNNLMNNNRRPFNPRTDSNFMRNYRH